MNTIYNKKNDLFISDDLAYELAKVDGLMPLYSQEFVNFIKNIIIDNNLNFEDIENKLPSATLIIKDENRFRMLKHIYGEIEGIPISYMLVESIILNGSVDCSEEQLYYYNSEDPVNVPFTKEEFLSTIPAFNQKTKKYNQIETIKR